MLHSTEITSKSVGGGTNKKHHHTAESPLKIQKYNRFSCKKNARGEAKKRV